MRTLAEIVPLRTAACREAVDAVAQIAAGEDGVDPRAGAHVRSCLRCQAEVAAYRRVIKIMRQMRADCLPFPVSNLPDLLRDLEADGASGVPGASWAARAACVGGITAAGAAGVLVWFSRRRLLLPDTG